MCSPLLSFKRFNHSMYRWKWQQASTVNLCHNVFIYAIRFRHEQPRNRQLPPPDIFEEETCVESGPLDGGMGAVGGVLRAPRQTRHLTRSHEVRRSPDYAHATHDQTVLEFADARPAEFARCHAAKRAHGRSRPGRLSFGRASRPDAGGTKSKMRDGDAPPGHEKVGNVPRIQATERNRIDWNFMRPGARAPAVGNRTFHAKGVVYVETPSAVAQPGRRTWIRQEGRWRKG